MKTTKLYIGMTIYFLMVIAQAVLSGAVKTAAFLGPDNNMRAGSMIDASGSVRVYVYYTPGNPGQFAFDVFNDMQDTVINDFHIQLDSAFSITNYTPRTGWVTDSNSTNTGKGRLGVRCGPQGHCIEPGQHGVPIGNLRLQSNTTTPTSWLFNWQATRDGQVVAQGRDTLR